MAGLYRATIEQGLKIDGIRKRLMAHRLHYGHLHCAQLTPMIQHWGQFRGTFDNTTSSIQTVP